MSNFGKAGGNGIEHISTAFGNTDDGEFSYVENLTNGRPSGGLGKADGADVSNINYSKGKYTLFNPMDINITFDQIEEIINLLKQAANELKNSWDGETKTLLNQLESSWIGPDCIEYTEKLLKMNKRVHRTIDALDLIRETFTNARDISAEHQKTATNIVARTEG